MRPSHALFAVLITIIWGVNFIFVRLGLNEMPLFLLCTIRFILSSIPAIFIIKKPNIPWSLLIAYGMFVFAIQFGLLFAGIEVGMPPGLTSLLTQMQVFFSILFATFFLNEKPNPFQILGAFVAFIGLGYIGWKLNGNTSVIGFLLVIGGAIASGAGSLITKKIGRVNALALVAWGSFVATIPLLLLTLLIDGPHQIFHSLKEISWTSSISILYITYGSTWLGYGIWSWLLSRYTVSAVVPFMLLIPVFGMLAARIILNEPLESWKISGGCLIFLGLGINIFGPRLLSLYRARLPVIQS